MRADSVEAPDDNRNLDLEVLSLLLFLVALLFVLVAVLATVLYLGTETLPEMALTEEERAKIGPYGIRIAIASLLLPAATIGFLLFGIRIFLVRSVPETSAERTS